MAPLTPNDRRARILHFSREWNVVPPALKPLTRPLKAPSFRTTADDGVADDLLRRHGGPKSKLSRFSSRVKDHDVLDALRRWVANAGSPGVAEALIARLNDAGVDLAGMKKGGLLRRKSVGSSDRSLLLKTAVEGGQLDMLRVLLPHADAASRDACLPIAVRRGDAQMVECLLIYGAGIDSPEGQDTFRQACANNEADIVGLIVQQGRLPSSMITECLCDAVSRGCVDVVLRLSRTADGNHNQAEALRAAVGMGRRDMALAIVMGEKPPQGPGLDEAFRIAFEHASLNPVTRMEMVELLLCAGAQGELLSQALKQSCEAGSYDMVDLLIAHGASIEYNDATVLKSAIAQGNMELVSALLRGALIPPLASSCVSHIPNTTTFETRHMLLTALLEKGANGRALDQGLIVAAEAGDAESAKLLLNPYFAPQQDNTVIQVSRTRSGRHAVASVNYRDGEALRTAVLRSDIRLAQALLTGHPSSEIVTSVFPLIKKVSARERCRMAEFFLRTPLSAACLHTALEDAIEDCEDSLMKLLLQHADVNYNQGAALRPLIRRGDVALLDSLLKRASAQTAAARVMDVLRTPGKTRFDMMKLLYRAGAATGVEEMSAGILHVLSEEAVDMSLLELLLRQANASDEVVQKAVSNPDPRVFELVCSLGRPTPEGMRMALQGLALLASTESKATKLRIVLAKLGNEADLDSALSHEVRSLVRGKERSFAPLELLLSSGADLNAHKAAALCHAVMAANVQLVDMLFQSKRPDPESLGFALPHALRVPDPMDRLALTKKLVEAGAAPREVNRALTHAMGVYPEDMPLLGILARHADTSDGEALSLAVSREASDIMDVLMANGEHSMDNCDAALIKAMGTKNREVRRSICGHLLAYGVSSLALSEALLVAARDGDVTLSELCMNHGARNGQAIVESCRGGSVEVLSMLLERTGEIPQEITEAGCQAATEVRDLNTRAIIFEQLLARGVRGELLDAQLDSAARYGESGQPILKVLLSAGADPNYNAGEAVVTATRSAFVGNLELLLGLWDHGGRQRKASAHTLIRALGASWNLNRDVRFHIVQDLFNAGLPVCGELHTALNDAVNEEEADERLVKLLLDQGASPSTNNGKTLVDAATSTALSCLALLLNTGMEETHISLAFKMFTAEFTTWFTPSGLQTMRMLLDKGAKGELSSALIAVIKSTDPLSNQFVDLLTSHGADVDYNDGEALRHAASKGKVGWVRRMLYCHPTAATLTAASHRVFDSASEGEALEMLRAFADHEDARIDGTGSLVLVRAMSRFPRSSAILTTLLDAGYYHDQAVTGRIDDVEEEMTLLTWAIAQPQKRVSSTLIQILLERGAQVNVQTSVSGTTPLMLAIHSRRPDIVTLLLAQGADADAADAHGRTPLSMATNLGDVQILTSILAAHPLKDDGSLHNAARELNLAAVKALLRAGHDADFPSPSHDGRSALGEVCLRASGERGMHMVMACLVDAGSDLSVKSSGKSLVHLCFESQDPVGATRSLLRAGLWRHINDETFQFEREGLVYSPTMYVSKLLRHPRRDAILDVLRAFRAADVYYAKEDAQPMDAVGLPARLLRQAEFALALGRRRQLAMLREEERRRELDWEVKMNAERRAQAEMRIEKDVQRMVENLRLAPAERQIGHVTELN